MLQKLAFKQKNHSETSIVVGLHEVLHLLQSLHRLDSLAKLPLPHEMFELVGRHVQFDS